MASQVEICNDALREIGAYRITSIDEDSTEANILSDIYDKTLEELHEVHNWNFATTRSSPARLSAAPAHGFDYAFSLPTNTMRVTKVTDLPDEEAHVIDYRIENGKILCNAETIYVTAVTLVTDPNLMSPLFRKAFALRLAEQMTVPLSNSQALKDQIAARYSTALRAAKSSDAIQDGPRKLPQSSWVTVR